MLYELRTQKLQQPFHLVKEFGQEKFPHVKLKPTIHYILYLYHDYNYAIDKQFRVISNIMILK